MIEPVEVTPQLAHYYAEGVKAQGAGDHIVAYRSYMAALALDNRVAGIWNNVGDILKVERQWRPALAAYRRAVALAPDSVTALNGLGLVLIELRRYGEAEAALLKAIHLDPDRPITNYRLAMLYHTAGQFDEALRFASRACERDMSKIEYRWLRTTTLLAMGRLEEGFKSYDSTGLAKEHDPLNMPCPRWEGENPKGKTFWVWAEQGMGDVIQFSRWLRDLEDLGGTIAFDVPGPLFDLMRANFVGRRLMVRVAGGAPLLADYYCPVTMLPHRVGIAKGSFEIPPSPYLFAPGRFDMPRKPRGIELRVGIVWAGNPNHGNNHARSSTLAEFVECLAVPGAELCSLQVGLHENDIINKGCATLVTNLAPRLIDMAATANALKALDLLVSVDTGVAHLAGALGVETHLVLGDHLLDWRWASGNPWYDSMTLHRCARDEDWAGPLTRIAELLAAKIEKNQARGAASQDSLDTVAALVAAQFEAVGRTPER